MAKTTSDKPSAFAEEALKRRKKQARQEAKLMLAIEAANKDLKQAQKRQSKAQARLEARSTSLQTLEAKLAELRAQSLEPESAAPPQSAELEHQQEQAELESSRGSSNGKQLASPETGASTSTDEEQHAPVVEEETTPSEARVATNDMIERQAVQNQETATESDTSPTPPTPEKAPAHKTAGVRTSTATKRPTSQSTVTKRSASRSQSTRQPHADAE